MKRILALINREEDIDRVLARSVEMAKDNDAILEILFVHETHLLDLPDFFKPSFLKEDGIDEQAVKDAIKRHLHALEYTEDVAIFVKIDDSVDRVKELSDSDTLVVSAYIEGVSEALTKKLKTPLLILKEKREKYENILIPVDLSERSKVCVERARKRFEGAHFRILYDYRYPYELVMADVNFMDVPLPDPIFTQEVSQDMREASRKRYYQFLDEMHIDGDFIEDLSGVDEDLNAYLRNHPCDLLFICTNSQSDLLDESVAVSLVKNLPCDIYLSNKGA